MSYKILALDLDGTLTDSSKSILPRTRAAVIEAQRRGVRVLLVSGRPANGIYRLAEELELEKYGGYIMAFNGVQVIECSTGRTVTQSYVEPELFRYICRCAKERGLQICTYRNDLIYTEIPEDKYLIEEKTVNRMTLHKVDDLVAAVDFPVPKCLVTGDPSVLAPLETEMRAAIGDRMGVFRSEPYFLEFVPDGLNKAKALEMMLGRLGVGREELMACGDGFNDIQMIEYAGLGVAMGNACEPVRAVADYVTKSNDEDGVAFVVEKFLLNR